MTVKEKDITTLKLTLGTDRGGGCQVTLPTDFLPRESCFFDRTAAVAACALSLSADDTGAAKANLEALGFGDIITADEKENGKSGMLIGSRTDKNILYTAVIIGGTQGGEWFSNFDVGYSAEHAGFSEAADIAELSLGDYIFTRAIGLEPRFFITGYSRGGAIADILAKRLCERYGTDSVWAYTVAAPRVTIGRHTSRFNCIFNLVRDEDIFTRLPPESWGYTRYGRDVRLRTKDGFRERFRQISGEDYIGLESPAPADSFLRAATRLAPNVHAYYKRQREIGGKMMSLYGFMTTVAGMLSGEPDGEAFDILISAMTGEYADLMDFLSGGADPSRLFSPSGGAPRCSVADSHSPAAYIASLDGWRL